MSTERSVSRRGFLSATAGVAGVAGAAGSAGAAEGGGGGGGKTLPDFGGYLSDANNGDDVQDRRGTSEVTVKVGAGSKGLAFAPAGIWIDPDTTVKWEWTGQGGSHNVHATKGADFESDLYSESGVHFQHTFDQKGIVEYQCDPHSGLGMLGAVAVGDDVPTQTVSTPAPASGGPAIPDSAKTLGVASFGAMLGTLGLGYVFLKYGGGRGGSSE